MHVHVRLTWVPRPVGAQESGLCCPEPPHTNPFSEAEWAALSFPDTAFLMQIGSDKPLFSPDPHRGRHKPRAA